MEQPSWTCPLPLRHYSHIVLGHGGGGQMTHDLIEHLFRPVFGTPAGSLTDAAVFSLPPGRVAFTTDSFVINPLIFPGGDIGSLAVHGTVNDLAMMGAKPLYLSVGFVLEEGLPLETLGQIVTSMAQAAASAGVQIITGDTKVVERGHGDGVYINTSGLGVVPAGLELHPRLIRPGDVLLVSGALGEHGIAIMSQRHGLDFDSPLLSDSASLVEVVQALLTAVPAGVRALRDLTRGGLAAAVNEFAHSAGVGLEITEAAVPVRPLVLGACELLGLDPFQVANEGKFLAVVAPEAAEKALQTLRQHHLGAEAAVVGQVTAAHPGVVVGQTVIGGQRVIDLPAGLLLPRIC